MELSSYQDGDDLSEQTDYSRPADSDFRFIPMLRQPLYAVALAVLLLYPAGCATVRELAGMKNRNLALSSPASGAVADSPVRQTESHIVEPAGDVVLASVDEPAAAENIPIPVDVPSPVASATSTSGNVALEDVIGSVYTNYPMLQAAFFARNIAVGENVSAQGQFDLKLKAETQNGPVGFYQTYRHSVGFSQPTWNGGEVFGGYRVGRGAFQPWYQERQTNDGGEFKAGASVPLLRNRTIDERRSEIFRTQWGVQMAEPDIQAQLIGFVQEASYAYWDWVAEARKYEIARRILVLAEERTGRIRRQVEEGFLDPPELTDNLRLVADRRAKLADARRKFRQKAIKLSQYYRDASGNPIVPTEDQLPEFPQPGEQTLGSVDVDIQVALANRPELAFLDFKREQLEVDYATADNDLLPNLDAMVVGSQDMGLPTSKKGDKSPFELEVGLFADVPLQRRKAQGKLTAIEGKMAQLNAKRRLTADKIAIDVQQAYIALEMAMQRVEETGKAVKLANDLATREARNEELGLSDMLKVALREQYAIESAEKEVDALLQFYQA
ncbi:MAG: TolC family protein, partial [Planctomycetaceae bacterium]|nr:TolC family protein [Planctomycetaceae bacterium]